MERQRIPCLVATAGAIAIADGDMAKTECFDNIEQESKVMIEACTGNLLDILSVPFLKFCLVF